MKARLGGDGFGSVHDGPVRRRPDAPNEPCGGANYKNALEWTEATVAKKGKNMPSGMRHCYVNSRYATVVLAGLVLCAELGEKRHKGQAKVAIILQTLSIIEKLRSAPQMLNSRLPSNKEDGRVQAVWSMTQTLI
jgi:hypothetical protein